MVTALLRDSFKCCITVAVPHSSKLIPLVIAAIESSRKNYQTSVYYMDIVSEFEKMGDFMINISQTLEKAFIKR